ncbi:MAG: ABC transporter ATP-binding protein [Bacteroidales bacterium]|nr:ABC transporter ATP-binding protein [Bacteroidales bacterium]
MIDLKNFSFAYRRTNVFDGINIKFEKGSIYGLLGENGVGKTTMLKAISGLLRPTAGTCTVDGFCSFDRKPEFLENIFFLPDDLPLPDDATPERFFREFSVFYPNPDYQKFEKIAAELHIDPRRRFKEMSLGQQKKSLISCALALNTDYLLLDEPTNGLDIPSKSDFRRVLAENLKNGQTIIISTHQVKDVETLINPIVIISNSQVLLNASVERITEKLYFQYSTEQNPGALYSDMVAGGYVNVLINNGMGESRLNLEALFNTVLLNQDKIRTLFGQTENSNNNQ